MKELHLTQLYTGQTLVLLRIPIAIIINFIIFIHTASTATIITAVQRHSGIHFLHVLFPLSLVYIMFPNLAKNKSFRTIVVLKHIKCRDDAVRLIEC